MSVNSSASRALSGICGSQELLTSQGQLCNRLQGQSKRGDLGSKHLSFP